MAFESVEQIIERQFKELSAKFKPVFGNEIHIRIVKDFAEIKRLEKMLADRIATAKNSDLIKNELKRLKHNTLYLLKR